MIEFKRDGTKVTAIVTTSVPMDCVRNFQLSFEAGSEWAAGLLANAMRTQFCDAVKQARTEEYEAGWTDAKSHKKNAKKDWFTLRLVK